MRAPGLDQRTRDFLLLMAQLAIIAYVFQILAVDHWFYDPSHLFSDAHRIHAQHCHGDLGGCSDGIGSAPIGSMGEIVTLPMPALPTMAAGHDSFQALYEAFIATPYEPPRAA